MIDIDDENTPLHPLEQAAALPHSPEPHDSFQGDSEEDVMQWAAKVRPAFGRSRAQFSFAVCEALAAAGIAPNAYNVLRTGKWGNNKSVNADVKAWYQTLSNRLKALESSIPLPARRQANVLLEQIFGIAEESSRQKMAETLRPLEEELIGLREAHAALEHGYETLDTEKSAMELNASNLKHSLDVSLQANATVQDALDAAERKSAADREEASKTEIALRDTITELRQSLLEKDAAHAKQLLEISNRAEAERRRQLLALDGERTAFNQKLEAAQRDTATLRANLEEVRQELSRASITAAGAQAALQGSQSLLASERQAHQQREEYFNSDDYRLQALLKFLMNSAKAGITTIIDAKRSDQEIAVLAELLGVGQEAAAGILGNIKRRNGSPANK